MRRSRNPIRFLFGSLPICLVLFTATLWVQPSVATAQLGEATSIARAMRPEYMTRDVQIFVEGLQLDASQAMIVETLFDDYNDSFELGLEQMSSRIEEMRDQIMEMKEDQDRLLDLVLAPISDWLIERDALGDELLSNVQVILMPYQAELYPAFEQRLYREKHLHEGRFSGESTDLVRTYRDMQLDRQHNEEADLVVEEYGHKLHVALRERTKALYGSPTDIKRLMNPSPRDAEQNLLDIDAISRLRVQVRDINDDYAKLIADALPSAQGEAFLVRAMEASYPRVYRTTPAERIFEDALVREDLDSDTLMAIANLMEQYLIELEMANINLLDAIRVDEPKKPRATAELAMLRRQGEPIPRQPIDAIRNSIRQRDELSREYIGQLRALLTPEQFAELPGARRWIPREERRANVIQMKGNENNPKNAMQVVETVPNESVESVGLGGNPGLRDGIGKSDRKDKSSQGGDDKNGSGDQDDGGAPASGDPIDNE